MTDQFRSSRGRFYASVLFFAEFLLLLISYG
jgi:hypothetical protein